MCVCVIPGIYVPILLLIVVGGVISPVSGTGESMLLYLVSYVN